MFPPLSLYYAFRIPCEISNFTSFSFHFFAEINQS